MGIIGLLRLVFQRHPVILASYRVRDLRLVKSAIDVGPHPSREAFIWLQLNAGTPNRVTKHLDQLRPVRLGEVLALEAPRSAHRRPFPIRSRIPFVLSAATIANFASNRLRCWCVITPQVHSSSLELVVEALMGRWASHLAIERFWGSMCRKKGLPLPLVDRTLAPSEHP
jgi:hypothetical protein